MYTVLPERFYVLRSGRAKYIKERNLHSDVHPNNLIIYWTLDEKRIEHRKKGKHVLMLIDEKKQKIFASVF
ncbi:MAG: hypothetical protein ACJAWV_000263 [Flammeovirgaceae bacterium]